MMTTATLRSSKMMFLFALLWVVTTCSAFVPTTQRTTTIGRSTSFITTMRMPLRTTTFRMASSDGGGPAVLDRPTETIEKVNQDDKIEEQQRVNTPGWEIRLFNDPYNKREFVARCLSEVCGKSDTESFQIMMQAHKQGMGIVGRYQFEIAELYYSSLRENGLSVDMVPVDDE